MEKDQAISHDTLDPYSLKSTEESIRFVFRNHERGGITLYCFQVSLPVILAAGVTMCIAATSHTQVMN